MRLVAFGDLGRERAGAIVGASDAIIPLDEIGIDAPLRQLLADGRLGEVAARLDHHAGPGIPLASVRLGPPIADPSKIICIGLNYHGHAAEQGVAPPARPLLFAKAPSSLVGATDPILVPDPDCGPDYEVELVVVIGRRAKQVGAAEAMRHVAGWMVGNDVSARRWQKDDGQWFRAKSCDTFFPCGPWLTTADAIPDHTALRLTTTIAGETLQDALAADLIHGVPALIAYISSQITLEPGDLISTGTPAGVGVWRNPKRFLRLGETVECAISDLGALRNPVAALHAPVA